MDIKDKIKARIKELRTACDATAHNPWLTSRRFELLEGISELEWVLEELEKE